MGSYEGQSAINVLYVDDEPMLLEVTKLYLEQSGNFNVDTEESATKALERLSGGTYDIVVSDYQMPEMDGIDFLKAIRVSGNTIPFIIFTGKGREEVVIQAFENGADYYLQKGPDAKSQYAELGQKIQRAVEYRRAEDARIETEHRLRDIIDFLPDATFAIDKEGRIIAWNRAIEKMTGYRAADIIGKGKHEYAIPFYGEKRPVLVDLVFDDDQAIAEKYPFIKREGNKIISEVFIPRLREGKGAYLWFIATPLYNLKGEIAGAIESIRDITDQKRAEEELKNKNEELRAAYEQLSASEEEIRDSFEEMEKSHKKLQKNEKRLHRLFDAMTEGLALHQIIFDDEKNPVDYRILTVNPSFERIIGIEASKVRGKLSTEAYGVDEPPYLDIYARVAESGTPEVFETYYPPMKKHFRISVYSPEKYQFATVFEDITDQKIVEEELKQSEEKLRSFFENLPDLILVHRDGIILYANPTMMENLDIRQEEILNEPFLDFVLPEYHERVAEAQHEREETGRSVPYEIELESPRGRGYAALVRGTMIDYEGSPANLVVLTDITALKKAEEALRKSERLLGDAMDMANLVNWEYDIATDTLTFDDRFYALYGTTSEREGGYQMSSKEYAIRFVHPDDRHFVANEVRKAIEATKPGLLSDLEHRIIRRDGEIRHIVVRIRVEQDDNGRNIKTYGANQDITLRKIAEEAVHEANRKLNILNSVTRHDIKNQITAMVMIMHLLKKKTKDEEILHFIEMEIDAAEQINRQIEFTKEYQDIGVECPHWQKVSDLIASAKSQFVKYPYEINIDLGPVEIYADPLVEKVFYNLLENVERHGKNASHVFFSGRESGGNYIVVCEDDGGGIDPTMKKDLFKRGHGKNTGYGLYLIREILSITGITIEEAGEPGKGARFEMTVPKGSYRLIPLNKNIK